MAATMTSRVVEFQPRPLTPPSDHLTLNTASFESAAARFLSTRIPYCSPGPAPSSRDLPSPPASPTKLSSPQASSLLRLPGGRYEVQSKQPRVHALAAAELAAALEYAASLPLPDPAEVFPWLHGLAAENNVQLSFFRGLTKNAVPAVPRCLRGITIVKARGDLSISKLKGAIAPDELLLPTGSCTNRHAAHCQGGPCFRDIDPARGFGIRNFKIQCCKMASVSDIVVYGDDATPRAEVEALASLLSQAQDTWRMKMGKPLDENERIHTFVLNDTFATVEANHPEIVTFSSDGTKSEAAIDFPSQERVEMLKLSEPSEIANNVFLGPTPEWTTSGAKMSKNDGQHFDILIETSDFAQLPEPATLEKVDSFFAKRKPTERACAQVDCPSSGSFGSRLNFNADVEGLLRLCRWIHKMANGEDDHANVMDTTADGELHPVTEPQAFPRKVLIHCNDGYTESSVLGICYFMYSACVPASEAWIRLHKDKGRNFFAYPADKQFLEQIERRVMWESPSMVKNVPPAESPPWTRRMDGSLPSRILPYLYLGNLGHGNNPGLLRRLGITHVLSVGEPVMWPSDPSLVDEEADVWPEENFLYIDKVQDNGVDPLTKDFARCLEFIEKAKAKGDATLVHCRVGVSRSATICIAEVMQSLGLSFPRAYCFVRARRLNVIIQPHLRFAYELLKWEEHQCVRRGRPVRRELEWATIAREIAVLNRPYCRD